MLSHLKKIISVPVTKELYGLLVQEGFRNNETVSETLDRAIRQVSASDSRQISYEEDWDSLAGGGDFLN